MPDSSLPQSLLQLHLKITPSPDDPESATEFYQALGIAVVAVGRLENHFLACIINILGMPETAHLAKKFPVPFSERVKIWNRAFKESTRLAHLVSNADNFIADLVDASEDRNLIAHGQWGAFDAGPPLKIHITVLDRKKGAEYGLDVRVADITLAQVREVAQRASIMNMQLMPISIFISNLRNSPPVRPSDVHRL
jgi:hypothetical protein